MLSSAPTASSGPDTLPDWATISQVAEALGISVTTLWRLCRDGLGPPRIVIGRSVRFKKSSILEWIASREREGL